MTRQIEKVEAICPNCGKKNKVLWLAWQFGHTGSQKNEKVEGKCDCGYNFKPDDLD